MSKEDQGQGQRSVACRKLLLERRARIDPLRSGWLGAGQEGNDKIRTIRNILGSLQAEGITVGQEYRRNKACSKNW